MRVRRDGSGAGLRVRTKSYGDKRRRQRCSRYWQPALCVLVTLTTTLVYYVAIRQHNVELSFEQKMSLAQQTTVLANRTFYVTSKPDDLVHTIATSDWAKVSARIDVVAYTKVADSPLWATKVSHALAAFNPPGLGVVLHPCGCVVPNALLRRSALRFGTDTCAMLPGFVFPSRHVAWIDEPPAAAKCEIKAPEHNWYAAHVSKLAQARADFRELKDYMIEKRAQELTNINKAKS